MGILYIQAPHYSIRRNPPVPYPISHLPVRQQSFRLDAFCHPDRQASHRYCDGTELHFQLSPQSIRVIGRIRNCRDRQEVSAKLDSIGLPYPVQ